MKSEQMEYDIDLIYDYSEYPDKRPGVCDVCGYKRFNLKIVNHDFIRTCPVCGLTKRID